MAEGGSLRRRDQIKSKARYSPPPFDTPKRERGNPIKFPSTTSSSKYVMESDDDEMVSVSPTFKLSSDVSPPRRKPTAGRGGASGVVQSYDVGVSRVADGSKLVVTLPDGSSVKVINIIVIIIIYIKLLITCSYNQVDASIAAAKKVAFKGKKTNTKGMEAIEIEYDDDGAHDDPDDDDYKPSRPRKKTDELKKDGEKPRVISTYSRVTPKQTIAASAKTAVSQSKTPTFATSSTTSTARITPKFVTTAKPTPYRPPTQKRTPQLTKYIDVLPELHECTLDVDTDVTMTKLPDKILLLHSELPLKLALSVENEEQPYLFRQIISPMDPNKFICLLCKGIDVSFATKEEKDIVNHYRTLHELEVVLGNAKFSEDIVFICLPNAILQQLTNSTNIPLNAPCQYCGDEVRLYNIEDMKNHYSTTHSKEVLILI